MSLILAVEPNRHRAAQLQAMARAHLDAEFVLAASVAQAFQSIGERVPDLLLMDPLLPPAEESALDDYLRLIGPAAAHLTSLRIPVLADGGPGGARSLLARIRREGPRHADADGCEPAFFAEQISQYLREVRGRSTTAVRPPALEEQFDLPDEGEPVLDLSSLLEEVAIEEPEAPGESMLLAPIEPEFQEDPVVAFEPEPVPEPLALPMPLPEPLASRGPEPQVIALEPIEAPAAPLLIVEPPVAAPAPMPQLVPIAAAPPPIAAPQVLPATMQHIVEVPTGNGTQVQAAVNVNVAVSVQVAAAVNVVAATPPKRRKPRPIQDEWGFFDPGQCGFQALMARLDEIAAKEERDDA
jgi:hypothetical protein